jgi:hypothetical protein
VQEFPGTGPDDGLVGPDIGTSTFRPRIIDDNGRDVKFLGRLDHRRGILRLRATSCSPCSLNMT